ncbi:hypothetical protein E2562_009912 [Oryza meyeriana var. granulata]|uniref:DUF6857 domain-containing protein n=1 Tax=Oryza meyeriana var. granulata TaxID=110450 RepID=A0A6G1BV27_9ORYZ|nr:hypothetical protein E2562_009912 [Oryza meyeriana var. granulata]
MEKPKKPALRRLETTIDVKKMSSSLNMSSSSLRSSSELDRETGSTGRRTATVRFAPTPTTLSSSSVTRRAGSSRVVSSSPSHQAGVGAARPATARPSSVSGPRARPSTGSGRSLHGGSPELGPKGLRRSWGWGTGGPGGGDVEEKDSGGHHRAGDTIAVGEVKAQVRSSSVPRRTPTDQEKQQQKRESKIKITSKTMANSGSPPKADDVSMERSSSTAARKTTEKAPSSVSLNNMVRASPPRKTTPATMGASWESLPPDLQSIGLEVMTYRDAAEVAAVEALQEASSAEILLRCLRAFADLAAVAAEQSPQQTVDEFLALQAKLARSAAAAASSLSAGHAEDWLRAAVSADLGHFSLYSASAPAAVSPTAQQVTAVGKEPTAAGRTATWLGAAAREVGEETCGWFLGHVERLIDADAAGTLGQLKRVNDWLEEAAAAGVRSSEAVERLRKKIFGYLLDHVESAVVALNGAAVAHGRRK